MGLHWGAPLCEADFITHRMDYFGPVVNRSARICGSAKGGQLMISNNVIKELSQHFPLNDTPPPAPPKPIDSASANDPAAIRERSHIETLRRMQFVITPVGERKLKGIEAPEALSLIWPKELEGRKSLMYRNDEEEVSAAAADANSRVPFSIAQMKQLAMLCIRLETLTSGRVFKAAPMRKKTLPSTTLMSSTAAVVEEVGPLDIMPGVAGITSPGVVHRSPPVVEEEIIDPIHLMANPDLLMPAIKEGSTDEYLMLLLDSLSLRIDNALASLYLKQLGGYRPLAASRVESVVELDGY
jgi:adenylate cyclase